MIIQENPSLLFCMHLPENIFSVNDLLKKIKIKIKKKLQEFFSLNIFIIPSQILWKLQLKNLTTCFGRVSQNCPLIQKKSIESDTMRKGKVCTNIC